MKILYYFYYDKTFMTEWQRVQIFDELSHSEVEFEVFNPAEFDCLQQCNETLVRKLKEDKSIDLFLTCLPDEFFINGVMEQIKCISVPKILIQFDNLHSPYSNRKTAPLFDLVWLTSWETEKMFKGWGCKTVFMPYAANPFLYTNKYHNPIHKVCFVGTPYGSRTKFINEIVSSGVGFDVFHSNGSKKRDDRILLPYEVQNKSSWDVLKESLSFPIGRTMVAGKIFSKIKKGTSLDSDNQMLTIKESLPFEGMNVAYSNYDLSLNVLSLRNTYFLKYPVHKLHLRTFEIPMCAGLELVSFNEELSGYFNNSEMVFFKDRDEMIDVAKYYTNPDNSSISLKMKLAARKRAENEHTWTKRFERLFKELNIKI